MQYCVECNYINCRKFLYIYTPWITFCLSFLEILSLYWTNRLHSSAHLDIRTEEESDSFCLSSSIPNLQECICELFIQQRIQIYFGRISACQRRTSGADTQQSWFLMECTFSCNLPGYTEKGQMNIEMVAQSQRACCKWEIRHSAGLNHLSEW